MCVIGYRNDSSFVKSEFNFWNFSLILVCTNNDMGEPQLKNADNPHHLQFDLNEEVDKIDIQCEHPQVSFSDLRFTYQIVY